ncbi:MAG TPA: winged helix DNA-binding domain-containing protein [Opitutaceae bacterium]|nr:winged helix DNA-binding domain-containing protein [Opitutaceae bacterium]
MATASLLVRRMHALLLHDDSRRDSVLDVVRWVGALQAQDYENCLWAVGVRTRDATRASVERALAEREIVRTWTMRGTWHLAPAADVRWMQDLLAARQLPAIRRRSEELGFSEAEVRRARAVVEKALAGGRVLPRPDLIRRLAEAGCRTEEQCANHLLRRFGNEGLLCGAVPEDREATFALRDEWITTATTLNREAALAELARRYFRSHGPATARDLAWWSGLPLGEVRVAIAAAGLALAREDIDGTEYWATADETPPPALSPAELLPSFDEHLLGFQDRTAALDDAFADEVCPGGNGVFRPTLVVRGRVAGTWKKREMAKQLVLEVSPRAPLAATAGRVIEIRAQRLGDFHGKPVAVRFL